MKFTNGYWHIRKEITPVYAAEYIDHRIEGNKLVVYAPGRHVEDRSMCVDLPMLTIRLDSPAEDIIHISIVHHEGTIYRGPFVAVNQTNPDVDIQNQDNQILYRSGSLTAVIDKRPASWKITFFDGKRKLTDTGYRNMAFMMNRTTNKNYMVEQLALDIDEYVYGLGERFTPFVKNGQKVDIWNEDGGTASEISYKNMPFYISNKGYGVLVDNQSDVRYEIASEKVERVQFSVEGERLDYYMISGHTPKGTIQKYTQLTGKPSLPPAWSFGLWLTTSFTTDYDEKTVMSFINGMEERKIPLSVFHYDCYWMKAMEWCNFEFDSSFFPDPAAMLSRLHAHGLKVCVWINPYIGSKSPLFQEGASLGVLLKKKDGSVFQTDFWQAGAAYVDFTNPKAVEWYQSKLKKLLDLGVDCFKTDFGERIPVSGISYFDCSDPVKMHNHYTFLYNKTVYDLLRKERGPENTVVFARSATVGSQQFPVHWGGDCNATYAAMAETLRGGLSLACCGFGFWSHDISGFENKATPDLYKRWCAFGLLSSHSRLHGSTSYRVPWLFDEEACDVLKYFVNLKCSLMPYLYSQAVKACSGTPMMRPMFIEFPGDKCCETLDKQYMLGDSLLIAPVMRESGEVDYYLPAGKWINLITKEKIQGGRYIHEKHGYFSLPLMVRQNTILPIGSCNDHPDYDYTKDITFLISDFTDGGEANTEIVDLNGRTVAKVSAKRNGNSINVSVQGIMGPWGSRLIGSDVTYKSAGESTITIILDK